MDRLIRAILRAAGRLATDALVNALRDHLVDQGVTSYGSMLNLVGLAGGILISEMVRRRILTANRGLRVYTHGSNGFIHHVVIEGAAPLNIWLSGNHFQPII